MLGMLAFRSNRLRRAFSSSTSPRLQHRIEALLDARCRIARSGGTSAKALQFERQRRTLRRPAARTAACRSAARPRARAGCAARRSAPRARAVRGSTFASSACSAGQPRRAASASISRAQRGVGLRQRVEAGDQRAVVEHRAADEQRDLFFLDEFQRRRGSRLRATAPRNSSGRGR